MSEEQAIPNDPNSPPWSGDPNAPNAPDPDNPRLGGQVGIGGGVDQTTGTPASPYEGPGYQGTRNPQPGGPGGSGGADLGQTAGAADPGAGAGAGTDLDDGLGGSGSGYGGPVSPGGEADMPSTDPGQAGNVGWAGQGSQQERDIDRGLDFDQDLRPRGSQSQGNVNAGQGDTGSVNRTGSDGQAGDPDHVGIASDDSFPASDSPSFNPGRP